MTLEPLLFTLVAAFTLVSIVAVKTVLIRRVHNACIFVMQLIVIAIAMVIYQLIVSM